MIQPIQQATGTVGVQMAVNLETNFPYSLNQQLKINLPTIESLS
jgi:hypothetical protein